MYHLDPLLTSVVRVVFVAHLSTSTSSYPPLLLTEGSPKSKDRVHWYGKFDAIA